MTPPKETRCAEGRGRPEGGTRGSDEVRTQSRVAAPPNLARVHEAARRDKSTQFTALLHHVNVAALLCADQGWTLRRETTDRPQAVDPEDSRSADRAVASHARACIQPAPLDSQRAAWALRVLRSPQQLAANGRVPRRDTTTLVQGAPAPKPASAHVASVQHDARTPASSAGPSHHP